MALHTVTSWIRSTLGLVPNYVMLVLGNEGGGPDHIQGCHTRPMDWFQKASDFF